MSTCSSSLTRPLATVVETRGAAVRVATKIQKSLSEPFQVEGAEHAVSASVGVSLYPDNGNELTTLLQSADAAMYKSKGTDRISE